MTALSSNKHIGYNLELLKIEKGPKLQDILSSSDFKTQPSTLRIVLGNDLEGRRICPQLEKLQHVLLAGNQTSNVSNALKVILLSLLYQSDPTQLKLLFIDSTDDFSPCEGIPHLVMPLVRDVKTATKALSWLVQEMNKRLDAKASLGSFPRIVCFISDLADYINEDRKGIEISVIHLLEKAASVGIHLVIATRQLDVSVLTPLIRSQPLARICLSVAHDYESKLVMDITGAENLKASACLFKESTSATPIFVQTCSQVNLDCVCNELRTISNPSYQVSQ